MDMNEIMTQVVADLLKVYVNKFHNSEKALTDARVKSLIPGWRVQKNIRNF